jgi:UDP-N-acetylmuramate: L-alanyl-gamma-D-glutamyl-meso-diaminopimelate ligase
LAREHVHLIGIGGTGMTALAGLLTESGCRVTGSDHALYPPTSTVLEELGLEVFTAFDASHLRPPPDLVVVGNAVRRGNPEAEEVLDRRLPHTSMARLVSERYLEGKHSVVVAGTHGKTTKTSMLAWVLHRAGRDPGFLVGGVPMNFGRSYRLGSGPAFVIEGDEYDTAFFDKGPKFMHYRPDTAIVGTVEFDHADIYRDLDQVKTTFARFTNIIPRRGLLVRHDDCETTREVTAHALSRVEGYGIDSGGWRAVNIEEGEGGSSFRIDRDGRPFARATLPQAGVHNVRNALAVTAAAVEQGLSADEIVAGLASFEGVKRRLEPRGEVDGITVLDDFAHHPSAIAETLGAVRRRHGDRRICAVFEPRSWSLRRNVFQDRLAGAFAPADVVVLADVFGMADVPEDERLDPQRVVRELVAQGKQASFIPEVDAIVERLAADLRPGDVVAVMSNGGFGGLVDKLLRALEARAPGAVAGRSDAEP